MPRFPIRARRRPPRKGIYRQVMVLGGGIPPTYLFVDTAVLTAVAVPPTLSFTYAVPAATSTAAMPDVGITVTGASLNLTWDTATATVLAVPPTLRLSYTTPAATSSAMVFVAPVLRLSYTTPAATFSAAIIVPPVLRITWASTPATTSALIAVPPAISHTYGVPAATASVVGGQMDITRPVPTATATVAMVLPTLRITLAPVVAASTTALIAVPPAIQHRYVTPAASTSALIVVPPALSHRYVVPAATTSIAMVLPTLRISYTTPAATATVAMPDVGITDVETLTFTWDLASTSVAFVLPTLSITSTVPVSTSTAALVLPALRASYPVTQPDAFLLDEDGNVITDESGNPLFLDGIPGSNAHAVMPNVGITINTSTNLVWDTATATVAAVAPTLTISLGVPAATASVVGGAMDITRPVPAATATVVLVAPALSLSYTTPAAAISQARLDLPVLRVTYAVTHFPTTGMLDDFNRADGALGSNWTAPTKTTHATPTIWTNRVVASSGNPASAYWNGATYLDCEAHATFYHDSGDEHGVYVRLSNPNTGSRAGYEGYYVSSDGRYYITRFVNDTTFNTLASVAGTFVSGDVIGLDVRNVGNDIVLRLYRNGALILTATDTNAVSTYPTTLATAGYIAIRTYGAGNSHTRSVDNFGGGAIVTNAASLVAPVLRITLSAVPASTSSAIAVPPGLSHRYVVPAATATVAMPDVGITDVETLTFTWDLASTSVVAVPPALSHRYVVPAATATVTGGQMDITRPVPAATASVEFVLPALRITYTVPAAATSAIGVPPALSHRYVTPSATTSALIAVPPALYLTYPAQATASVEFVLSTLRITFTADTATVAATSTPPALSYTFGVPAAEASVVGGNVAIAGENQFIIFAAELTAVLVAPVLSITLDSVDTATATVAMADVTLTEYTPVDLTVDTATATVSMADVALVIEPIVITPTPTPGGGFGGELLEKGGMPFRVKVRPALADVMLVAPDFTVYQKVKTKKFLRRAVITAKPITVIPAPMPVMTLAVEPQNNFFFKVVPAQGLMLGVGHAHYLDENLSSYMWGRYRRRTTEEELHELALLGFTL